MDEPTPPAVAPQTPYRAGKALAEIIPPDRRRLKAALLVATSMIAGVALWEVGGIVLELARGERELPPRTTQIEPFAVGRIGPSRLSGPGVTIAMPPPQRSVVNVWLQGCSDCMPAFEAMAKLQREGGLGISAPVINVAYGEADLAWAQRYGVASSLVFDPGGANVVRPLGIGTFTTLVVEPDGRIVHRDRPDRPGYASRVRAALGTTQAPTYPLGPAESELPPSGPLDQQGVERVIAAHRAGICWERRNGDEGRASANITVSVTIAPNGSVSAASATGDDPVVASCIEAQMRTWTFPAGVTTTNVNIPFKFVRQ